MGHHVLEIAIWLLLALIIGWLIGWFLRCVLFRREERAPELPKVSAPQFQPVHKPVARAKPTAASAGTAATAATAAAATAGAAGVATLMGSGAGKAADDAATKADKHAGMGAAGDDGNKDGKDADVAASAMKAASGDAATSDAVADAAVEAAAGDMPAYGLSAPLGGKPDDLQLISGIGPKLEKLLHEQGIFHFAQIAAWKKKDIEEIDAKLKFKGRIEREEWVRQAKLLAAGKLEQFEREYGTGGKKGADGKTRAGTRTRKGSTGTAAKAAGTAGSATTAKGKGGKAGAGVDKTGAEKAMPAHGLSAPVGGKPDDLQMISGIGPKLEKLLHEQGIFHFAQIAAWKKKDIEEIDAKLKFKGRIEREEWVRQAKLLAAGKLDQFEREYGTGGKKGADGKTRSGSRTRKSGRK